MTRVASHGRGRRGSRAGATALVATVLLVAAPVAAVLLVAAPPGWSQTGGADEGASSESSAADGESPVRLVETSTWLDPDGEIAVTIRLAADLPDDATVQLTLHEAIRHRTDLRQTIDRSRLGGRLLTRSVGAVAELDPDGEGRAVTERIPIRSGPPVPGEPPRLGLANPGVHPVDVSVIAADGERLGGLVTYVVRPPLELTSDPARIVLVQPLDAPPSHTVDGTAAVDRTTRATWTVLAAALDSLPDVPVVLSPRPETLDALAVGGPLDRGLVAQLADAAARGVLATTPYVAVDIDGALQAGLGEDLEALVSRGRETATAHLRTAPAAGLWVADESLTTLSLGWLAEQGIDTMIVPHGPLEPLDSDDPHRRPLGRPMQLAATGTSGLVALVTDPLLQAHLASSGDPRLDAQRVAADLALDWLDAGAEPRAHVVLFEADGDPLLVEALADLVAASPLLTAVDPDAAIDATPLATTQTASGTERPLVRRLAVDVGAADLTQLRRDLDLARLSIASVRSVFPDDEVLFARYDTVLAVLHSERLTQADRSGYLVDLAREMDGLLDGIELPSRRAITLPARDGTIPITLTNSSGRTAAVAVRLESDKLEFPDGDRVEVPLPEGTSTVEIDVRARASGAMPLDITLESPDGRIELGVARYTVRSTAVSGLGVAISIAAIVVLAVWWLRTARGARAAHREHHG